MRKIFIIFLSAIAVTGCNEDNHDVNLQESLKKDTTVSSKQIIYDQPRILDSSHIVIYPLIMENESYSGSYSSRGQSTSYWNLIFYNAESGTTNLLTIDKKILIYSINIGPSPSSSSYSSGSVWTNGINVFKDNILYTVISKDYNSNKKLDQDDPNYLYVSSKEGSGFRQISPDDHNIISWDVIKGTSKIIMQGQKDENGDKKFNEKDSKIPLVVDLGSAKPVVEVFKTDFVDSLKKKLVTIWKAQ